MRRREFCLAVTALAQDAWRPMFDGKSLQGWRSAQFRGRGEVRVEDGAIVLTPGGPLTGINWMGPFPKQDFELRFEAMRRQGGDFFASVTFPVRDSFCTWVTGGWGGDIVGLSSIDGWDASENETRAYYNFENGRWYAFRLRFSGDRITAWIDEKQIVDVAIGGRTIGLRPGEIQRSTPFGFAAYNTAGAIREIGYRSLARP